MSNNDERPIIITGGAIREAHYLSAWDYFWLRILYALPIIGFLCLVIHACTPSHENRCHFARSYFCWLLFPILSLLVFTAYFILFERHFDNIFEGLFDGIEDLIEKIGRFIETIPNMIDQWIKQFSNL